MPAFTRRVRQLGGEDSPEASRAGDPPDRAVTSAGGNAGARIALADGGVTLSRLAAGCLRLVKQTKGDLAAVHRFIDAALEVGTTTFDLADIYGGYQAETLFGRALKERPSLRAQIELVSKCGVAPVSPHYPDRRVPHIDSSAEHVAAAVERSLKELRTDRLDVLLLHRPDPLLRADELASTFVRLRDAGKVRAFGVSNFSVGQFALLQSRLPFALVTNQIELSILHTKSLQDGTLDQLRERGLAVMAWSPLAGGRLLDPNHAAGAAVRPVLARLAMQHGVDPAAIAIAWVMRLWEGMLPVLGTSDPSRLQRAAQALRIVLDRQDWFELYAAAGNRVA